MIGAIDLIRRIKEEKGVSEGEIRKPAMFYLPAGLEAEFRALVGAGFASQIVEALIRDCLMNAETEGLVTEEDRARMLSARSRALKKADKESKRNATLKSVPNLPNPDHG